MSLCLKGYSSCQYFPAAHLIPRTNTPPHPPDKSQEFHSQLIVCLYESLALSRVMGLVLCIISSYSAVHRFVWSWYVTITIAFILLHSWVCFIILKLGESAQMTFATGMEWEPRTCGRSSPGASNVPWLITTCRLATTPYSPHKLSKPLQSQAPLQHGSIMERDVILKSKCRVPEW